MRDPVGDARALHLTDEDMIVEEMQRYYGQRASVYDSSLQQLELTQNDESEGGHSGGPSPSADKLTPAPASCKSNGGNDGDDQSYEPENHRQPLSCDRDDRSRKIMCPRIPDFRGPAHTGSRDTPTTSS